MKKISRDHGRNAKRQNSKFAHVISGPVVLSHRGWHKFGLLGTMDAVKTNKHNPLYFDLGVCCWFAWKELLNSDERCCYNQRVLKRVLKQTGANLVLYWYEHLTCQRGKSIKQNKMESWTGMNRHCSSVVMFETLHSKKNRISLEIKVGTS